MPRAWNNRGAAKAHLGKHKEAIEDFNKAIKLDPKYASAWNNRGAAKADLGDHKEAIEDYNRALEWPGGSTQTLPRLSLE